MSQRRLKIDVHGKHSWHRRIGSCGSRFGIGGLLHGAQPGPHVAAGREERGHRVAGQPEDYRPFGPRSKPHGLAGALVHFVKNLDDVQLAQQAGQVVGAALAHGPAQHHGIEAGGENVGEARAQFLPVVGQVKQRNIGPGLGKQGLQGIGVGPPNLVRQRRLVDAHQLIAGAHHGHARGAGHRHFGGPHGGGNGQLGGAQAGAGPEQGIAPAAVGGLAVNVDAGRFGGRNLDGGAIVGQQNILVANDGIGARREHGPGHHLDGTARVLQRLRRRAGVLGVLDGKRRLAPRPGGVLHRNAVHGHPVEGREVAVGREGFGQHAAIGVGQGYGFGRKRAGGGQHEGKGFSDGEHGRERGTHICVFIERGDGQNGEPLELRPNNRWPELAINDLEWMVSLADDALLVHSIFQRLDANMRLYTPC